MSKKSKKNSKKVVDGVLNPINKKIALIGTLLFASIATVFFTVSLVANAVEPIMNVVKPEEITPIAQLATGPAGWYKTTVGTATATSNAEKSWSGSGSAKLSATGAGSYAELGLYKYTFASNRLANLPMLGYATWQQADNKKAVSLQIGVDTNVGDGDISDQGRLVFEPYLNNDNNFQPLTDGTWQGWIANTPDSQWWMTWSSSLQAKYGENPCAQSNPCSFYYLLERFPAIGFNAGFSNPLVLQAISTDQTGFTGYADVPAVGTAYKQEFWNFEPSDIIAPTEPTLKDECKDDRWQNYGTLFKNQGQCVSYVVTR